MTFSGAIIVGVAGLFSAALLHGATPLPVDARASEARLPTAIRPASAVQSPSDRRTLENRRLDQTTTAPVAENVRERTAPLAVHEAQPKTVRENIVQHPSSLPQPRSAFDGRNASIATADTLARPPLVKKYQDSLAAASAANMSRFPAADSKTVGRINRFVFRKNGPSAASPGSDVSAARRPSAEVVLPDRR